MPHNDVFDDLDEQGEQLLGSLHLGPTEEEPVRRGAASRANSVRFDESALHGSSWGGQNNRHSGDFGPVRPGSGLMMERSLSHKSDGRHSSAGHSVHSHHSVASGRASSLGLDTNFMVGDDDDESFDIPGPPPSFYVLGTVPSIVRCWLTTNFAHGTLLYADVCTGSQKSTVDFSLLKELDLLDEIQRDVDGVWRARLNVYFAEAVITQHSNRSGSTPGPVPSAGVYFEVVGTEPGVQAQNNKAIRIYLGSDALRAHSADVMFSQNTMTLYSSERDRLQVPFVRPEDEAAFRNICTATVTPEKHKLNANAAPFVLSENGQIGQEATHDALTDARAENDSHHSMSPTAIQSQPSKPLVPSSSVSEAGGDGEKRRKEANESELDSKEGPGSSATSEASRRESSTGIWASWRQGPGSNSDNSPRESGLLSGYQPAVRSGRNMRVLKSLKSGSISARTGASYEPPPMKSSSDGRRKSQASIGTENGGGGGSSSGSTVNRWETKRTASIGGEFKSQTSNNREVRNVQTLPRSANPVGVASAFSWMTPTTKPKATAMD